jgi:Ca2+-binding EF-hand superfamily protein
MKTTLAMICALGLCASAPAFAEGTDMAKTDMMVDASMKMMDTNSDGMISLDERAAACKMMFTKADANGDGMLSSDEMVAAATAEKADMGMTPDPAKIKMMVGKKIAMMDTDKDGMVSMAEEDAASMTMFTMSDTNKDNMLSRQEMIDGMTAHMKMMK